MHSSFVKHPLKATQKRILFITQWQYADPLVQTYTLPYVQIIQKIAFGYSYVVTTNSKQGTISIKKKGNIISIELPSGKGFLFLGWAINILSLQRILKKKSIKTVHTICTPAGAIGVVLKMMDKSLTLNIDSFEPHAEPMVENGTWKKSGLKFKVLFYFEKLEAKKADNLILAAPGMEKYVKEKYKTVITGYSVKPACTDLDAFSDKYIGNPELIHKYNLADKIVCVYAGKFGGIYLEDETFAFIKNCELFWGKDKFRFLLLSNSTDEYLAEKIAKYGIEASTTIKLYVNHKEIPFYMGLANFAISPYKPVPSKKYCTPIKDGEYWAMGLPIVITPEISIDSEIVKDNMAGAVLDSFDEEGYVKAIMQIDAILKGKDRAEIYKRIRPLAEKYRNYNIAENVYKKIYG